MLYGHKNDTGDHVKQEQCLNFTCIHDYIINLSFINLQYPAPGCVKSTEALINMYVLN